MISRVRSAVARKWRAWRRRRPGRSSSDRRSVGIVADRREHPETRLAAGLLLAPEQAVVEERSERVEARRRRPRRAPPANSSPRTPTAARTAPAPAGPAGRSSTRSSPAASDGERAGRGLRRPGARADGRSAPGSAAGDRRLLRAAASSIASGTPSRRRQISPTDGAFASVSSNPGSIARARATNTDTESFCSSSSSPRPARGVSRGGTA